MKTILVTGSSRGIGRDICISLSKKGHQVYACSRKEINIPGCIGLVLDPGNLNSIKKVTEYFKEKKVKIDGLVNNAGLLVNKPFLEISEIYFKKKKLLVEKSAQSPSLAVGHAVACGTESDKHSA